MVVPGRSQKPEDQYGGQTPSRPDNEKRSLSLSFRLQAEGHEDAGPMGSKQNAEPFGILSRVGMLGIRCGRELIACVRSVQDGSS